MSLDELRRHLIEEERRADLRTLNEVATLVRCGVGTLQSADRTADIHRRRCVAAWILTEHYRWPVEKMAKLLNRTERQAYRMLGTQRVATRKRQVVSC